MIISALIDTWMDSWPDILWTPVQAVLSLVSDPRALSDPETWQWAAPALAGAVLATIMAWMLRRGSPATPDVVTLLLPGHAELVASPLAPGLDQDLRALASRLGETTLQSLRASHALGRRLRMPKRALQRHLDQLHDVGHADRLAALLESAQRHRHLQSWLAQNDHAALEPGQRLQAGKWLRAGQYGELEEALAEMPEQARAGDAARRLECAIDSAMLAGRAERAEQHGERALNAWLASEEPRGCLRVMAKALRLRQRDATAGALIEECERWVHLVRSLSDMHDDPAFRAGMVKCCLQLGDACYVGGERQRAHRAYDEALARLGQQPDASSPSALTAALVHQRLAMTAESRRQQRLHAGVVVRLLKDSAAATSRVGADLLASAKRLAS